MAENGKGEYAVYLPIKNAPGSCARLGPTWPSYGEAAGSESAKLRGAFIVEGERASLRAQLSAKEARKRQAREVKPINAS